MIYSFMLERSSFQQTAHSKLIDNGKESQSKNGTRNKIKKGILVKLLTRISY